jgi:hypothetical protein
VKRSGTRENCRNYARLPRISLHFIRPTLLLPFLFNVLRTHTNGKKIKPYKEVELIKLFDLKRLVGNHSHPLLHDWLTCETTLNANEQYLFDRILTDAKEKIDGWHEEDLKMRFIAFILQIANLAMMKNSISLILSVLLKRLLVSIF